MVGIGLLLFVVGCPSGNSQSRDPIQGTWNGHVWEGGAPNTAIAPYSDQYTFNGLNFTGTAYHPAFGDVAVEVAGSFAVDTTTVPNQITLTLQSSSRPTGIHRASRDRTATSRARYGTGSTP